jgi:hypothetical protein
MARRIPNWCAANGCLVTLAAKIIQDALGIESDHNFSRNGWHLTPPAN